METLGADRITGSDGLCSFCLHDFQFRKVLMWVLKAFRRLKEEVMKRDEAAHLRVVWQAKGNLECDHSKVEKECYEQGESTGNYVKSGSITCFVMLRLWPMAPTGFVWRSARTKRRTSET